MDELGINLPNVYDQNKKEMEIYNYRKENILTELLSYVQLQKLKLLVFGISRISYLVHLSIENFLLV